MKKFSKAKKNFIYSMAYRIISYVVPLILAPYLSRCLGSEGLGIYSYTYSIVSYFIIFTVLGVNVYGNRCIAQTREDKEQLSKTFFSIYAFQFFMGVIMFLIYIGYLFLFNVKYKLVAGIQSFYVIASILEINWLFSGLEKFKVILIRSAVIRTLAVICVFSFVHNPNDVWKYALILSGSVFLTNVLLWVFARKEIHWVKVTRQDIVKHIKPNLILFIPVIASSIYQIMDKIMLGFIANVSEVGLYEQAEKIISVPVVLISTLGTVMLPYISNMIVKGEKKKVYSYLYKSLEFNIFLSVAMMFGLLAIGLDFAPFFFGTEFTKSGYLIVLLAITLPFKAISSVLVNQYLVPKERDKVYIASISLGAIVNMILNAFLISKFYSVGACISTILAEVFTLSYQIISILKEINLNRMLGYLCNYFCKGFIMFIIVVLLNKIPLNTIFVLIIQVLVGVIVYGLLNKSFIISIIGFKGKKGELL